jgi:hypothetical protein
MFYKFQWFTNTKLKINPNRRYLQEGKGKYTRDPVEN